MWVLTQALWILSLPCLWSNQRSNLDAEKTGRVTGKTCLPCLQGKTTLSDQLYEDGGYGFGFQSVENRVVARQFADEFLTVGRSEIAHKPTPRDSRIYLEDGREKGIGNGE